MLEEMWHLLTSIYNETCINQTLNKPEFCLYQSSVYTKVLNEGNKCQNNLYKPDNCRNWTLQLVLRRFGIYMFHCTNYFRRIRVIGALHHFQQYFSYVVVAMEFYIVEENCSSWRKSQTFYYSLTDSLTYCEVVCIEYSSLWEGVEITNHSADGWHWLYHQWW